jgi:hypothetical protein
MSCKGLSLGIKELFSRNPSVSTLYTYLFAMLVIICIIIQMNYLNKSLDIFNTPIVTTVYYVLFTLFVMIASALLFKEFLNISFQDFVGCICGFSTIVCALFLIQFFKTTNDEIITEYNADKNADLTNSTTNNMNNNVHGQYDRNLLKVLFNDARRTATNNNAVAANNAANTAFNMRVIGERDFDQQTMRRVSSSNDMVKSVTIFKTKNPTTNANSNNQLEMNMNSNESASAIGSSSIIPITGNIFKKLAGNYKNFQKKFTTNPVGSQYNYNKLISKENYEIDEDEFDEDDEDQDVNETTTTTNHSSPKMDTRMRKTNEIFNKKTYSLINNTNVNSSRSSGGDKRENTNNNSNRSFDEKLFSKKRTASINNQKEQASTIPLSTSLIGLES